MAAQQEGRGDALRLPLARRFVLWVALLAVVELVVWVAERFVLAPLLAFVVRREMALRASEGMVGILGWAVGLVWRRIVSGDTGGMGLLASSAAILLAALMALLMLAPIVLVALGFARQAEGILGAELRARDDELRHAYERRNLMISDMAHDLRTPVMGIAGMAQALDEGLVGDPAEQARLLGQMRVRAQRLSELVSLLFDYVKLESEGYALDRTTVDLPQLLLSEAATAYDDIEAAGMELSVHVDEEPLLLWADETQLRRVVANLLANAVRHNEPGTTIELALGRRAGVADIIVGDTGKPIRQSPAELFAPFSRGDEARSGQGSGLGLSIVADIVALHGYSIDLHQPYGPYTKAFVVTCGLDDSQH